MVNEVKKALRVSTTLYDTEIASLINAAVIDLKIAGIVVEGVNISVVGNVVTDTSTLDDAVLIRAIIFYVRKLFGSPDDYERVSRAYDEMKAQLQSSSDYGLAEADNVQG